MKWNVIFSEPALAEANMLKDAALLEELKTPTLHFYEWENPSLTYGHFIKPEHHLSLEALRKYEIEMARRPTGGGIIFHLWDMVFSVLVPASAPFFSLNTLDNYAFINRHVAQAIKVFLKQGGEPSFANSSINPKSNFCMAEPTIYDLIIDGRKVGGAAQRRTKKGFLHQGTISLLNPSLELLSEVILEPHVLEKMRENSYALIDDPSRFESAKEALRGHIIQSLRPC